MNSLNILSTQVNKVIGNTPPSTPSGEPRTGSGSSPLRRGSGGGGGGDGGAAAANSYFEGSTAAADEDEEQEDGVDGINGAEGDDANEANKPASRRRSGGGQVSMGERIYMSFLSPWLGAIKWIISTIAVSTDWLASCFYSDEGALSPLMPVRRIARWVVRPWRKRQALQKKDSIAHDDEAGVTGSATGTVPVNSQAGHHRARSFNAGRRPSTVESITPRRSIRIQIINDEKQQKNKSSSLKSPTSPSPSLRLTKYPRIAGPPVPLLSRKPPLKTLILDLDETLIHSLAKGGRMSSGHMVEVKLDRQHAILYYVHKRPYCDEFLRKVAKWYNLVVFTASVQEYADPVIDWLEQDRKYFKGRYYRQHCTNRNGAYIKDLTTVEPDLSKVMIIDNSPTSYIFHEDNAIPIEGWINDPTDTYLLHLIPLLQALQYVADVRALLALRMGDGFS